MARSTFLIALLLPARPPVAGARRLHDATARELTDRFGGLTRHHRAPADGRWKRGASTERDAIIVYEVLAARLDRAWWRRYRKALEKRFRQESVVIRATRVEML